MQTAKKIGLVLITLRFLSLRCSADFTRSSLVYNLQFWKRRSFRFVAFIIPNVVCAKEKADYWIYLLLIINKLSQNLLENYELLYCKTIGYYKQQEKGQVKSM